MSRTVVVSSAEWIGQITETLRPRLGIAAEVADHKPIVCALFDHLLHGAPLTGGSDSLEAIYEAYGLFTEVRQALTDDLLLQMSTILQRGFGLIYPARHYTYHFFGLDNILLRETLPSCRAPTDADDLTPDAWQQGLEQGAGDYYPERLRRSMGC
jgi:hypothetical protein